MRAIKIFNDSALKLANSVIIEGTAPQEHKAT